MTTATVEWFPTRRVHWLVLLRLAGEASGAGVVVIARWLVPSLPVVPLLLVLAALAVFDLGMLWYLMRRQQDLSARERGLLIGGQLTADVIGLTLLLHFSGGAENPFFPFYAFPVVLAAALLSRRAAFAFAGLASALFSALLAGEAFGWLPHYHLAILQDSLLHQRGLYLIGLAVALAATCFLICGATVLLVGALRSQAKALSDARERAETRAANMRELNNQLRAANQECKHSREHLDALYYELQQAYSRLEGRSQHMSELNEQLRAANAECRSKREELAEVYNQLQEAYQRLEQRSRHMHDLNDQLRAANEECKRGRDELVRVNKQLAEANAKLLALDDARAQFTLLVTHELRAPVAAIQSYLKLILEGYVPDEKVQETLEKAERRAMEQLALIADLLELGRVQAAEARGQVTPVQVDAALREQVDMHQARAAERRITIHCDIEPDLPSVLCNGEQITSVWNNLISNAIKYNKDGGDVEIRLRRQESRLVGSVSDTGIGVPPEALPRLFSEFFRAENAKAVSRMGTGLGLSIVKEIIERSGGKISVTSQLDQGTCFEFWLPVAAGDAAAQPTEPVPNDAPTPS